MGGGGDPPAPPPNGANIARDNNPGREQQGGASSVAALQGAGDGGGDGELDDLERHSVVSNARGEGGHARGVGPCGLAGDACAWADPCRGGQPVGLLGGAATGGTGRAVRAPSGRLAGRAEDAGIRRVTAPPPLPPISTGTAAGVVDFGPLRGRLGRGLGPAGPLVECRSGRIFVGSGRARSPGGMEVSPGTPAVASSACLRAAGLPQRVAGGPRPLLSLLRQTRPLSRGAALLSGAGAPRVVEPLGRRALETRRRMATGAMVLGVRWCLSLLVLVSEGRGWV